MKDKQGLACINCDATDDGLLMIDNENEAFVGPFCSMCFDYIRRYDFAAGFVRNAAGEALSAPPPTHVCDDPQDCEALIKAFIAEQERLRAQLADPLHGETTDRHTEIPCRISR